MLVEAPQPAYLPEFLERDITVDLSTMTNKIPPIGKMEGIDLVTEGVHTVNHTLEILQKIKDIDELSGLRDGSSLLAREFLFADCIYIFLGQAINPAHLNPNLPQEMGFKSQKRPVDRIDVAFYGKRSKVRNSLKRGLEFLRPNFKH